MAYQTRRRDPLFDEQTQAILAVADAGGGDLDAAAHRGGRVEEQLALLGQDQPARVTVEERGVERLLQRADLPRHCRLAEIQHVAGMGQAAGIGDGMKDPKLVPIHEDQLIG